MGEPESQLKRRRRTSRMTESVMTESGSSKWPVGAKEVRGMPEGGDRTCASVVQDLLKKRPLINGKAPITLVRGRRRIIPRWLLHEETRSPS